MLTGQRLFSAETIPETLAHVMTRAIDLGTLPATTPRHMIPTTTASSRRPLPWIVASVAVAGIVAMAMPTLRHLRETPPVLATAVGSGRAGSWSADGTILFAQRSVEPLWRVAAAGDEPVAVTELDSPRQDGHGVPYFLPDGRHFLFYAQGTPEAAGISLGSLDGGAPTRLTAADSAGAFLPPDQVVFVRQGTLVARRLDLAGGAQGAVTGDPVAGRPRRRGRECPRGLRPVRWGPGGLPRWRGQLATAHLGRPDGQGHG